MENIEAAGGVMPETEDTDPGPATSPHLAASSTTTAQQQQQHNNNTTTIQQQHMDSDKNGGPGPGNGAAAVHKPDQDHTAAPTLAS